MANSVTYDEICRAVKATGLICRGGFHPVPGDKIPGNPISCIMVGNAGPQFWSSFERNRPDGRDPIEAWTSEVLTQIATEMGGDVLFPFSGPPFHPFLAWAKRSEPVWESPIGLLIHPVYGLWHAYRGMLLFKEHIELPETNTPEDPPCDTCRDKPCKTTCPVDAVTGDLFGVQACAGHIETPKGEDCLQTGCAARRACPVGPDYLYPPAQAAYHMQFFLDTYGSD